MPQAWKPESARFRGVILRSPANRARLRNCPTVQRVRQQAGRQGMCRRAVASSGKRKARSSSVTRQFTSVLSTSWPVCPTKRVMCKMPVNGYLGSMLPSESPGRRASCWRVRCGRSSRPDGGQYAAWAPESSSVSGVYVRPGNREDPTPQTRQ
jgi:hypothetical protein